MARYALVIGIDTNKAPLTSLSKTAGDARAIADLFDRQGGFVSVKRLIGAVTQAQLEGALQALLTQQAERNEVVIYYTGHGFPLVESFGGQRVYLAAADCQVTVRDGQVVGQQRGTSLEGLNNLFRSANLSNLVVLLECCYGGGFLENSLVRETMTAFTKTDYFLIAACRDFEQAYALKVEAHSIFTTALLAGLRDGDDLGQVTTGRLFDFIYGKLQGSGQEPIALGSGRSLTLMSYQQRATAPIPIDDTNPYQGLLAFTKETAKFFFGRERVVQDLIGKLQSSNFVPLIGASGSGKSSVVRAGVVPRLEELGWRVLEPMKPGVEPIYELKRSLDPLFDRRKLAEIHQQIETNGLRSILELLPDQKHLLVVDQFEEVFTLSESREKQRRFIELLTGLEFGSRLSVVVTMRSDFVEAWQAHGDLVAMLQGHTVWMPPLEGEELRQAIVGPAKVQGYELEVGLDVLILDDMATEANALPLLEFALEKLWEHRDQKQHRLKVASYRQMGRLMGALNQYATEWYEQELAEQEQYLVRRVMLELVRVGLEIKDTRWRRKQSELLGLEDGRLGEIIEKLVDEKRLLVREKGELDLAHERLMDGWELFAKWRLEDRDLRRLAQRIQDCHKEWIEQDEDEDFLIRSGLLKQAQSQWLELYPALLSQSISEFYNRSVETEQNLTSYYGSINQFKEHLRTMQNSLSERLKSIEDLAEEKLKERSRNVSSRDVFTEIQDEITSFMNRTTVFESRIRIAGNIVEWIDTNHERVIATIINAVSLSSCVLSLDQSDLHRLIKKESRKLITWLKRSLIGGQIQTENMPNFSGIIPREPYINSPDIF